MITSTDQAKEVNRQHNQPCHDCPMRRKEAVPGWLGGYSTKDYLQLLYSDSPVFCHTRKYPKDQGQPHCAGVARFRSNICKVPRDPNAFELPKSSKVFAGPAEFLNYHGKGEE